jgi:hypothetical protein
MTISGGEIKCVVCAGLPHHYEMTEAGFRGSLTFSLFDSDKVHPNNIVEDCNGQRIYAATNSIQRLFQGVRLNILFLLVCYIILK